MQRLALACAFLLAMSTGCRSRQTADTGGANDTTSTSATLPEPASDTASGVRDFSFEQRQEFAQSIRQQLVQLDQEIDQLASQAKSQGGAVSDRALARIRSTRQSVDRNLQRIDAATTANWEQLKGGVNQGVDRLNQAIDAAQPK
jgi:hypothetical protein